MNITNQVQLYVITSSMNPLSKRYATVSELDKCPTLTTKKVTTNHVVTPVADFNIESY